MEAGTPPLGRGEFLRARREELGLRIGDVARDALVHPKTVARAERGMLPKRSNLDAICLALGMSADNLPPDPVDGQAGPEVRGGSPDVFQTEGPSRNPRAPHPWSRFVLRCVLCAAAGGALFFLGSGAGWQAGIPSDLEDYGNDGVGEGIATTLNVGSAMALAERINVLAGAVAGTPSGWSPEVAEAWARRDVLKGPDCARRPCTIGKVSPTIGWTAEGSAKLVFGPVPRDLALFVLPLVDRSADVEVAAALAPAADDESPGRLWFDPRSVHLAQVPAVADNVYLHMVIRRKP